MRGFCNSASLQCDFVRQSGTVCDDGDPLTTLDVCVQGVCNPRPQSDPNRGCGTPSYDQGQQERALRLGLEPSTVNEDVRTYETLRQALGFAGYESARIIIPVVFHVLYNTPEQDVPDTVIQSQIDRLNEDFRALNSDLSLVPAEFRHVIADTGVEFRLARRTPDCQATSGIRHVQVVVPDYPFYPVDDPSTPFNEFDVSDQMKKEQCLDGTPGICGTPPWDPNRYLNVWLVQSGAVFDDNGMQRFREDGVTPVVIYGFSTRVGHNQDVQGVVLDNRAVGIRPENRPEANLGRTATHEVMHYFEVEHTFFPDMSDPSNDCEGRTDATCADLEPHTGGDSVCDTPATLYPDEILVSRNSCVDQLSSYVDGTGAFLDPVDPTFNYMHYGDDPQVYMFTAGQKAKMLASLYSGLDASGVVIPGSRSTLLTSDGHLPLPVAGGADLWVADSSDDLGEEPNVTGSVLWQSGDIWVRNQADGLTIQEHQNPLPGQVNYAYVRVRNRSCGAAAPSAEVQLYWAKNSMSLGWPAPWDGSVTTPALMGSLVNMQATLDNLPASGTQVLEFPWTPPSPAAYASFGGDRTHFCLLARVQTTPTAPFGMTFAETGDFVANIANNNNVVLRNVSVVDDSPSIASVSLSGNGPMRLVFAEHEVGRSLFAAGAVFVDLGPTLHARWIAGGSQGTSAAQAVGTEVQLTSPSASLSGFTVASSELFTIDVRWAPFPQVGVDRLHPLFYFLDAELAEFQSGAFEVLGGQRFAFKTLKMTAASGSGGGPR